MKVYSLTKLKITAIFIVKVGLDIGPNIEELDINQQSSILISSAHVVLVLPSVRCSIAYASKSIFTIYRSSSISYSGRHDVAKQPHVK